LNYRRHTLLLIAVATILRMIVAGTLELGNDEVYYRLFAQPLQWNYFDHPPMVGWLIRLSTFNLLLDNAFMIRLGAIVCSAVATWLMYKCGERLVNGYTGFLAALLYTATIYGSIIAGTFVLPDSPQMVCWVGSLYLLIKITETKYLTKKSAKNILWFGVLTGLGMLCKIHTVFLWLGFLLYLLLYCRDWLKHWSIYAAASITILFFTPVLLWNVQNNFITFFYHGERVNIVNAGLHAESFFSFAGGQVFYCNPVVFFLIIRAVWHRDLFVRRTNKRILLLTAIPLIVVVTVISLFKEVLPHWTSPAYASLVLLTASYYSKAHWASKSKKAAPVGFILANALLVFIVTAGLVIVFVFPGTLGSRDELRKGEGDITLDVYGWKDISKAFDSIYFSSHSKADINSTVILSDKWFPAAHIEYYVAKPLGIPTVAVGPVDDIHQYHWLNQQHGLPGGEKDVYIISPSNCLAQQKVFTVLSNSMPSKTDTIIQYRNKEAARKFYIYYYRKVSVDFNKTGY